MIPFCKAYEIVLAASRRVGTERVAISNSLHRVLAEDVKSDVDMPPFNKSAMDGFACRREDLGEELTVLETIPAGKTPEHKVGAGECARIMTGAPVPDGADCVFMIEYSEEPAPDRVCFTGSDTRDNICPMGEDVRVGDIVLEKGAVILPQHIASLASVGCAEPPVSCRPRVGVIATGDELVEPTETPDASKIRNSNSYQLCAQVRTAGAEPIYFGIASDTEEAITGVVGKAAAECDVILVSGGVSAGDFDFVPGSLAANDFELLFEKVATKPGMPTVFGTRDDCFCFGLPGNPVSTFVLFELLVRAFLSSMMGHELCHTVIPMRLDHEVTRRKTDRDSWIPVSFTADGGVLALDYHGSGHLNALCGADGMICMPVGTGAFEAGSMIDVRMI